MPTFVRLTNESELPAPGSAKEFPCNNKVLCVANVGGNISVIDNACLHRGGPLSQGMIESGKIICPWHGWQWDLRTGEASHNSAIKLAVYPAKIQNSEVLIEL